MIALYSKGKDVALSKNFRSSEFDCKGFACCCETLVDTKLVDALQKIRDHFGKTVTVNSGYRCKTHNKAVGGVKSSKHMTGTAADIAVSGVAPEEVAKYAESIGVLGIGLYAWGCHIDTRTVKGFWYSASQEPRTTFGGALKVKPTVLEFQKAAIADGFKFQKYGADGKWGIECESVARKAVCKKHLLSYKYRNLTKLIQLVVGVSVDGKFGNSTKKAVIAWQKENGLTADGVVGIKTWKKLLGVLG